jgi:spore coat polysaccharide biosynthesis protein SpsF
MKVVLIIQARLTGIRLPGKVLLPITGIPLLKYLLDRISSSETADEIIVAIPDNAENDSLLNFCKSINVKYFRGSEYDVLDRFQSASEKYKADIIVRLTADNPFIDRQIVDDVVNDYLANPVDYVGAVPGRNSGLPVGISVEVISADALSKAWAGDISSGYREHVTPYIYKNQDLFTLRYYKVEKDYSNYRITVDTVDDYMLANTLAGYFSNINYSWVEVVKLLEQNPNLLSINSHISQVTV